MAHIVVIEDEPNLRVLLNRLLSDAGHRVTTAPNGSLGLQAALGDSPDLVILDLMLPDLSGEQVLHVLLASDPTARVVVLSSVTEVGRRVGALDAGAVDFLGKPFSNGELLARVRLRLRSEPAAVPSGSVPRFLRGSGFQLDLQRRELLIDDQRIMLPNREFVLLAHLLHRRGEVCTRQELLSDVWGLSFDPGTNVVDVYVRRLRAKLTKNCIETVRNVGYRFIAC
jgi:two-component system OmpR family response regulator